MKSDCKQLKSRRSIFFFSHKFICNESEVVNTCKFFVQTCTIQMQIFCVFFSREINRWKQKRIPQVLSLLILVMSIKRKHFSLILFSIWPISCNCFIHLIKYYFLAQILRFICNIIWINN